MKLNEGLLSILFKWNKTQVIKLASMIDRLISHIRRTVESCNDKEKKKKKEKEKNKIKKRAYKR